MTHIDEADDDPIRKDTATGGDEDGSHDKLLVEIWKQAIDTQKHFNDMCVKSRQLGLTFVAAALGAAIFLFTRTDTATNYSISVPICGRTVIFHFSVFIVLAALAAVYAVKQLDLGVYHQMLRGAVAFNEDFEERHLKRIVGSQKGLTQAISHFSRNSDAKAEPDNSGGYKYTGDNRRSAGEKIGGFYKVVMLFLLVAAITIFGLSNFIKAIG